ncbi:Hypothetical protein AA314_05385 [Archangium gephyra]|uniref:Uncharacterized protein n=1 Tax=Archangium gephyra TaxID=48 RepID=A0AAC8QA90_9BACT|nr:Hypothetical protein AA314_05385 [Archangium gephyra]
MSAMNQAAEVINLDEFRKRREAHTPAMARMPASLPVWSPVWVWVMVYPHPAAR